MRQRHHLLAGLIPLGIIAGFSVNCAIESSCVRADEPRPRVETGEDADPAIVPVEGRLFGGLGRFIPRIESSNAPSRPQGARNYDNRSAPSAGSGGSLAPQPDGRYAPAPRASNPAPGSRYPSVPSPSEISGGRTPSFSTEPLPRATAPLPRATTPLPRAIAPSSRSRPEVNDGRGDDAGAARTAEPAESTPEAISRTPLPRATEPGGFQPIPRRGAGTPSAPRANPVFETPRIAPRKPVSEPVAPPVDSPAPVPEPPSPEADDINASAAPPAARSVRPAPILTGPKLAGPDLSGPSLSGSEREEPDIAPPDRIEAEGSRPRNDSAGPSLSGPVLPAPDPIDSPAAPTLSPSPEPIASDSVPEPLDAEPPPRPRATLPRPSAISAPRVAEAPELRPIPRRSRAEDFQPDMESAPRRAAVPPSDRSPNVIPPQPTEPSYEQPLRPITIAPHPDRVQGRTARNSPQHVPQYEPADSERFDPNRYDDGYGSRSTPGRQPSNRGQYKDRGSSQNPRGAQSDDGSPLDLFRIDRFGDNMRKMNPFRRQ